MVAEFYNEDALPGVDGFDPAGDDFLMAVVSVSNVSFRSQDYKRLVPKNGFGKIRKNISKTLAGFSLTLSNSSREIIDFENLYGFDGLICIVRIIDRATSVNLNDSMIVFTGRCEEPDEFTKSSETAKLSVTQILNKTEVVTPRRKFTVDDILGRAQSDPLFQGFPFVSRGGNFDYQEKVAKGGFFGNLFGLKKNVTRTASWSAHSDVQEETCLPVILGRTQAEMITFAYEDVGTKINMLGFWADGHEYGIKAVNNIHSVTPGMTLFAQLTKLGLKGGTVDDADHQANDDPAWIGAGTYSESVYTRCDSGGTTLQSDDAAPTVVGIPSGQKLPIPNDAGAFETIDWSDNAVAHSRWLLNSPYYFNLAAEWHDDEENLEAYEYNNHYLVDRENTDTVLLNSNQSDQAGINYRLYKSTGAVAPQDFKGQLGEISLEEAAIKEADYNFYDNIPVNSDDPAGTGVIALPDGTLRRRYTCNLQLLQEMKTIDFLYDIVFQTSNLYLVQKSNGRFAHRSKKPVDFSFIYASSAIGDDEIHIKNVNNWIGKETLLLIGANLSNSEIRRITGYRFDTAVEIAISASGGVSASGAALSGGSDTVAPHATLTVSSASGAKTISIAGFEIVYTPQPGETTDTCAGALHGFINAHNELNKFVKAVWNKTESTVTVSSRIGYLTLDSALDFAHLASIADPTDAASLTALSGGSLAAGVYQYCYSLETIEGETLTSPITEITLAANQKIETEEITLPSRVVAVRHYISTEANGVRPKLIKINDGSSFVIDALPKADDRLPPVVNATAEELHHIALAFTDKANTRANLSSSNMLKGSFSFPKGGKSQNYNQVIIKFRDAAADYKLTTLIINDYVKQAKVKKIIKLEINGAGIDNHHQARRIGNQKLAEFGDGNKFVGFSSDNEALLLEEGDPIAVTDESGRYVNEPVRVEEIDIDEGGGYPFVTFTARKYRRYFYDDQIQERLVPLPIIQNSDINREQKPPTIFLAEDTTNDNIKIGVTDYSTVPNYRETWMAVDPDFATPADTVIRQQSANNTTGEILADFLNIVRGATGVAAIDDLDTAVEVNIKSRHSSNGIKFGKWSNVLTASYKDSGGDGGSTGEDPPPSGGGTGTGGSPPTHPDDLEVAETLTAYARLTWFEFGGTGLVRIMRKEHFSGYVEVGSVAAGVLEYEDTAFVMTNNYTYKVTQDGVAGESNPAFATVFV